MTALGDHRTPTPFEGFVHDDFGAAALGDKSGDQQQQQTVADGERDPTRPVEHVMKATEVRVERMADEAQGAGDGPAATG